ncbi:hypothetical protein AVEN_145071-1, partial [Araneus ventricosus]
FQEIKSSIAIKEAFGEWQTTPKNFSQLCPVSIKNPVEHEISKRVIEFQTLAASLHSFKEFLPDMSCFHQEPS